MSSVYLDTCIVIYLVEAHPDHAPRLERLLEAHPVQLCVSPLVVMESLVLPLRHQRESQVRNSNASSTPAAYLTCRSTCTRPLRNCGRSMV